MLNWFSTADLERLSRELVDEFAGRYPLEEARGKENRKSENKRVKATRELFRKVTDYQREHPLWLYKKAKLCKLIQGLLTDRGYPEAMVSKLGNDLVVRVTAGVKRRI